MTKRSKRLSILYHEYPGDDAWDKFVACFPDVDKNQISQMSIDSDMIRVLYWKKGDNIERVRNWLTKPLPALDGNTPINVFNLEEGRIVLRTAIMRMP